MTTQTEIKQRGWRRCFPGVGGLSVRLYKIWTCMRGRCTNRNYQGYKWYGGKGVSVCEEWSDYSVFRQWAICNGYNKHMTIDRIDSDGNYEPSNCQWLTMKENLAKKKIICRPKGEDHPFAVLTEDEVIAMRKLLDSGKSVASIARKFGVSWTHTKNIKDRKNWAHI